MVYIGFFVQQVPNDDPLTGNGTSLPDGAGMVEGEEAELTEEQIAKNKEAEEAFKVQASCFATASGNDTSVQHALQACGITYAFTGWMVMLFDVSQSHNRQSKVLERSVVSCMHALNSTARLPSNRLQPIARGRFLEFLTHCIITASQLLGRQDINKMLLWHRLRWRQWQRRRVTCLTPWLWMRPKFV